jgi:hypothetical protein
MRMGAWDTRYVSSDVVSDSTFKTTFLDIFNGFAFTHQLRFRQMPTFQLDFRLFLNGNHVIAVYQRYGARRTRFVLG